VIIKDATLEGTLQSFDVTLTYDAESSKLAAIFPWLKKPPFCPLEGRPSPFFSRTSPTH
jgi:hypothetical protein